MMPGMPERRTHDYARNGTTSLFAAFTINDGTVISEIRRRHRAVEYMKFLVAIDKAVPDELDVHLVVDNLSTHKTPAVKAWLARHPRFHVHFTRPRRLRVPAAYLSFTLLKSTFSVEAYGFLADPCGR